MPGSKRNFGAAARRRQFFSLGRTIPSTPSASADVCEKSDKSTDSPEVNNDRQSIAEAVTGLTEEA